MIDISELLKWFVLHNAKKSKKSILDKQSANRGIATFLDRHLTSIIQGRTTPPYKCSRLVHDLVSTANYEFDFIANNKMTSTFKREAFNNAVKFLPQLIMADSIESDDLIVITWYRRISQSECADLCVLKALPTLTAYFSTVTPIGDPGKHIVEVWRDLWARVRSLHSADNQPRIGLHTRGSYLAALLDCLAAILSISKQTPMADQPWEALLEVIDDVKMCQRVCVSEFPELLRLLRVLLHQWGYTYRVQLVAAMESMVSRIRVLLEGEERKAEWSSPWSEIKKESSPLEHAFLLLEEYELLKALSAYRYPFVQPPRQQQEQRLGFGATRLPPQLLLKNNGDLTREHIAKLREQKRAEKAERRADKEAARKERRLEKKIEKNARMYGTRTDPQPPSLLSLQLAPTPLPPSRPTTTAPKERTLSVFDSTPARAAPAAARSTARLPVDDGSWKWTTKEFGSRGGTAAMKAQSSSLSTGVDLSPIRPHGEMRRLVTKCNVRYSFQPWTHEEPPAPVEPAPQLPPIEGKKVPNGDHSGVAASPRVNTVSKKKRQIVVTVPEQSQSPALYSPPSLNGGQTSEEKQAELEEWLPSLLSYVLPTATSKGTEAPRGHEELDGQLPVNPSILDSGRQVEREEKMSQGDASSPQWTRWRRSTEGQEEEEDYRSPESEYHSWLTREERIERCRRDSLESVWSDVPLPSALAHCAWGAGIVIEKETTVDTVSIESQARKEDTVVRKEDDEVPEKKETTVAESKEELACAHSGYLCKKGGVLGFWSPRWYVLDQRGIRMLCYDSPECAVVQGEIDLRGLEYVDTYFFSTLSTKEAAVLEIRAARRTYSLMAYSLAEAKKWKGKIANLPWTRTE